MIRVFAIRCVLLLGLLGVLFGQAVMAADTPPRVFPSVLDRADFRGGLIVHLGCGDGRLTGQLTAPGNGLVHGLDTDAAKIQAARTHLQELGLDGRAAVDTYDGRHLPYADNLVNLLVVSGPWSVERAEHPG
jgi:predicted RNA methylase